MRESPVRRLLLSALVALGVGLLVAYANPVRAVEATLDRDFAAPVSVAAKAGEWLDAAARR